jgi:hypothetical protein
MALERRLRRFFRTALATVFRLNQASGQAALHGELAMAAGAFRFQYRLRTLFLFFSLACLATFIGRIICLQQQARFHHRQVEEDVRDSERQFLAGRPFSCERWKAVRRQLTLACAYEHALCHPWLTLSEAHAEVERTRLSR